MGKIDRQNTRLNRAIILSAILHILLLGLLIFSGNINEIKVASGGNSLDAFTVDPATIQQQYQRLSQHAQQAKQNQKVNKTIEERQNEELRLKQAEDQRRMLELQKQQIKAKQEDEARQQAEKQAQALATQKTKQEEAARKTEAAQRAAELAALTAKEEEIRKAHERAAQLAKEQTAQKAKDDAAAKKAQEVAQKVKDDAAAKKAQEVAQKVKDDAAAKKAQEVAQKVKDDAAAKKTQEAAQKAQAAKKANEQAAQKEFDSTLDDLLSSGPIQGATTNSKSTASNQTGKTAGASNAEVDSYMGQITNAIQNNFRDPSLYRNKTCTLKLILMPDGKAAKVTPVRGDDALCRVAVIAASGANIPPPPNDAVYKRVKDIELVFKPE